LSKLKRTATSPDAGLKVPVAAESDSLIPIG
jgi:hypothetical protein